ncbi:MAG: ATP-binding cassette domain-containing protein [Candidatus Bathyarchaeia archaeon]
MPTPDMKAEHILEVDSLTVRYVTEKFPVRAVDGVTLVVDRGEAFGLAGESGSGKSTLANTILRILPSNAEILMGRILFEGEDILKIAEEEFRSRFRWRRIAIVPQATMNSLTPVHRVNRQIVEAILTHETEGHDSNGPSLQSKPTHSGRTYNRT